MGMQKHGIEQVVNAPEVGRNFHDHLYVPLVWKLKNREHNLPIPLLASSPALRLGYPCELASIFWSRY